MAGCRFVFIFVSKQTTKGCFSGVFGVGYPPVVENRSRCSTSLKLGLYHPHFSTRIYATEIWLFIGVYYLLVITVIIVFTILYSVEITLYVTFHKVLPLNVTPGRGLKIAVSRSSRFTLICSSLHCRRTADFSQNLFRWIALYFVYRKGLVHYLALQL